MKRTIAAALALALGFMLASEAAAETKQDDWSVRGLKAPAEIVVDRWGVAHIYAGGARDAYFIQGYNAARDRLWQIDLWRKRGLGLLSKSFGPAYVEQDRAARLFLYRGDMNKEWASYAPDARAIVTAFTDGINAYVAEVRAGGKPLPVEFTLTNSEPDTWEPQDVLRVRSHALVNNVSSEVARARVACAAGIEADMLRRKLEPDGHKLLVPEGLDPCDVPADVLKDYQLATSAVNFDALAGVKKAELSPETRLAAFIDEQMTEGSNNWIVAPSRTETGRPLLANDPHRTLGVPSLRYVVALHAPDLDIIGAGEPALPGISIGHNADIAFGITIFPIDQEDLYVYETKPGDAGRYRYKGGWRPMRVVRETIEVKGEAPRKVELRYTAHGPVLAADDAKNRAFAMRTVWSEPGLAGYFGSSRLLRAKSWDQFKDASNAWGAPPLNLVYADVSGVVGWAASGKTPVRPNWDGLMPVPGDGRYEWNGFHGKDVLPSSKNPAQGYFATANEMNLPAGYPAEERKISFEWTDPSRASRIKEVLAADDKVSVADSMAIQTDTVSFQSRRSLALLKGVKAKDRDVTTALGLLTSWDSNEATSSAAAAIYEVWATKHLGRATAAKATPEKARALVGNGHLEAVITYLETDALTKEARDEILVASLASALGELRERLGPDMKSWSWGKLHTADWTPAIAVLADDATRAAMKVGPLPAPGSASTPRAQTYRPSDFVVSSGASVRLVMDVGAWDNSMMINTPGQSGDPKSPHYKDLFPLWSAGEYVPLSFSREAVERNAERVIKLSPAGR